MVAKNINIYLFYGEEDAAVFKPFFNFIFEEEHIIRFQGRHILPSGISYF